MSLRGIDHVQLAMPPGGEERARAFYTGVLGLPEVPKPPGWTVRQGCWFENGEVKVHLGVEENFRPAQKAHPAFLVDHLAIMVARCHQAEILVQDRPVEAGIRRAFVFDPFGNRLELVQPAKTSAQTGA